jgi:hypothetical protein
LPCILIYYQKELLYTSPSEAGGKGGIILVLCDHMGDEPK